MPGRSTSTTLLYPVTSVVAHSTPAVTLLPLPPPGLMRSLSLPAVSKIRHLASSPKKPCFFTCPGLPECLSLTNRRFVLKRLAQLSWLPQSVYRRNCGTV